MIKKRMLMGAKIFLKYGIFLNYGKIRKESYTWKRGAVRGKLNEKEKRSRQHLPSSSYGDGDRIVIYTSDCGWISVKDLGVTCSRRFSVFFTCSCSFFSLLNRVAILLLRRISFSLFSSTFYLTSLGRLSSKMFH